MDILFHLTTEASRSLLIGFGAACQQNKVSWGCFFTNDGVKVLEDKTVLAVLENAEKTVVCEHSWDRFMGEATSPVKLGSQTINSAMMAEARRVVSL
ncbi:MAG: hypothetical protein COB59_01455 [Rhodospirillaceae bacterium]|nr:MAG: hypothetical protein COB59_01455 [Rhodospirillaceae bacterium]